MATNDNNIRVLFALGVALAVGAVTGLALGRLWPWLFAEALMGVAVAAVLVYVLKLRLDAPAGRRLALVAGPLTMLGVLAGRYLAAASTGVGPIAYLELLLKTEPLFGTLRLGLVGNIVVLLVQVALVATVTRVVGAAMSAVRGRGTPRAIRRLVADALARHDDEAEIRAALATRGLDHRAQSDALVDGRQLHASRPC